MCFKNILWCFVCLAKDPFYMQLTRDAYRRMFGNPEDKASYARVIFFLLLFLNYIFVIDVSIVLICGLSFKNTVVIYLH